MPPGSDSTGQAAAGMRMSRDCATASCYVPVRGFAKLDIATLKRLYGFSATPPRSENEHSGKLESEPYGNGSTIPFDPAVNHKAPDYDKQRRIQLEFRRLKDQVRGVDNVIRSKFCRASLDLEKLYRWSEVTSPDPATQLLHDELQASRVPFQLRSWRPLKADEQPEPTATRYRCLASRPTTAKEGNREPTSMYPRRPKSTPALGIRTPHPPATARPATPQHDPSTLDTLSPDILCRLLDNVQLHPLSTSYGDKILTANMNKHSAKDEDSRNNGSEDHSTTSGIDSDYGDEGGLGYDEADNNEYEENSDSETGGFEPTLEEVRRLMPHPQSLLRLRPEKLEAMYPEDRREIQHFDFDAGSVHIPPYLFKCPLPDRLTEINLRQCARAGSDWKESLASARPVEASLKKMMDRLVEIEKNQIISEEWESRKLRGQGRRPERFVVNSNNSSCSSGGCARLCLEDCPEKRASRGACEKCRQPPVCTGACQCSRYEQHMRYVRSSESLILDEKIPSPPPRYHSSLKHHNGKLINANIPVLVRPKSSNATFSKGRSSTARPKDLRPVSAASMTMSLLKDLERFGVESTIGKGQQSRTPSRNCIWQAKSIRSSGKNCGTYLNTRKWPRGRPSQNRKFLPNAS